jgi:succinate dehydrogenase flavin-adding protein (antitoxin of CptAB toxin-antitoxin module)
MFDLEWWEMASYVVTVIGLPFAIGIFIWEQRRERQNEEEELYQRLSDEYASFLRLVLEHADLELTQRVVDEGRLTSEQRERKEVIFEILTALFERAYILVYEEEMSRQSQRLWASWEDYMRWWCRRADFRSRLPKLLEGEDPDFVRYLNGLATEEAAKAGAA